MHNISSITRAHKTHMIQDQMPVFTGKNGLLESYDYREQCIEKGMYTYVSWRWINPFVSWIKGRKCLEIMAGAGHLTWALREKGIDIKSTDNLEWEKETGWRPVTNVEPLTANNAILKYGKNVDIVIMAWPPFMQEVAYRALRLLNYLNPNALMVFIGEWEGCTAEANFFANYEKVEDPLFIEVANSYERYPLMKDRIFLGRCRKNPVRIAESDD